MTKLIYEKAIKDLTDLPKQDLYLIDTTNTIYVSAENVATLKNRLKELGWKVEVLKEDNNNDL